MALVTDVLTRPASPLRVVSVVDLLDLTSPVDALTYWDVGNLTVTLCLELVEHSPACDHVRVILLLDVALIYLIGCASNLADRSRHLLVCLGHDGVCLQCAVVYATNSWCCYGIDCEVVRDFHLDKWLKGTCSCSCCLSEVKGVC